MLSFHSMLRRYNRIPEADYYKTLDRGDRRIIRDTYDRIMSKNLVNMGHKSAFILAVALAKFVLRKKVAKLLKQVPGHMRTRAWLFAEQELNL